MSAAASGADVIAIAREKQKIYHDSERQRQLLLAMTIEQLQHCITSGTADAATFDKIATARLQLRSARRESYSLYQTTEEFAVKQGELKDTSTRAFHRAVTPRSVLRHRSLAALSDGLWAKSGP